MLINKKLFPLLLVIPLIFNSHSVSAQKSKTPETQTSTRSKSILQSLIGLFKTPKNRLISRGGEVCLIAPGQLGEQVIWSDSPLFIWQGDIPQSQIGLYSASVNFNYQQQEQLLWQQTVPANSQTMAYKGEKLKPGLTYDWVLSVDDKTYRPGFILMEQDERQKIAKELNALESQLRLEAANEEDIAIAKADYFIKRELWSDAIQQLHTIKQPSAHLLDKIKDIKQYLC